MTSNMTRNTDNTDTDSESKSDWQTIEPNDRLRLEYTTTFGNESTLTVDVKEVRKVMTEDREIVESATGINREEDRKYKLSGTDNGLLTVKKLGTGSGTTVGHKGTATIEGESLSQFQ